MAGSSECLHKKFTRFSGEFWDCPMWKWASGVVATVSWTMALNGDSLITLRMCGICASQRSIPVICFTNCFRSVRRYLALEVRCSSSPCRHVSKEGRVTSTYPPFQYCKNPLYQTCVWNSCNHLEHAVCMSANWRSSFFTSLGALLLSNFQCFSAYGVVGVQPLAWVPAYRMQHKFFAGICEGLSQDGP